MGVGFDRRTADLNSVVQVKTKIVISDTLKVGAVLGCGIARPGESVANAGVLLESSGFRHFDFTSRGKCDVWHCTRISDYACRYFSIAQSVPGTEMLTLRVLVTCLILFAQGGTLPCLSDSGNRFVPATLDEPLVNLVPESRKSEAIDLPGVWESTVFGRQTLTIRHDGTGTLAMTLTPFAVPIYGRKVNLDLQWTLNGKYLTQHIVGGSPQRSVEKLIKRYGSTREFLLVEHDADYLLVRDITAGADPVRWTAVALLQ